MKTRLLTTVFLTSMLISCGTGSEEAAKQLQDSLDAVQMQEARQRFVEDSLAKAEAARAAEQATTPDSVGGAEEKQPENEM